MRNALSVDVEEWFQVGAFERTIDRDDWETLETRVAANTGRVLDLFDEAGVKATFFTLGWVAERNPALIRDIVGRGHEIASHGWAHDRVFTFTPDQFRADLARARGVIEDAAGVAVTGYRAPSFSIDTRTPWAHAVLAEAGYAYSSSVAPLRHDHYGWVGAPRHAHRPLSDSPLIELPVTIMPVLGRTGTAGGGFFRLLPSHFTDRAIRAENASARPAVFYFHPWEVDPDQPRVANAPFKSRLRHYSRLGAMAGKLSTLVRRHAWDRTDRVVAGEAERLA
ncbi:XrtA system polysaccharide deacetylase [Sphingomonas sp.]|uniref:XrtA system polysaccharide deacetylase n=1 Tax=Sphingomonas sp. TaxID=28214 RepID=UPI002B841085|nr:XrtA system polysaccharide deacetylase [Sphingomonas sp.]HWK37019.1 XrtA system polysaccharide deacetylase [Sphingomonas sp.]